MSTFVNVNGTWKKAMTVWVNVSGTWKKQKADVVKPVITRQPVNDTADAGKANSFSIAATGTGLKYQWYRNGSAISGATGSSYSVTYSTVVSYQFKCRVSNEGGYVDSSTVTGNWKAATLHCSLYVGEDFGMYGYRSGMFGSLSPTAFKDYTVTDLFVAGATIRLSLSGSVGNTVVMVVNGNTVTLTKASDSNDYTGTNSPIISYISGSAGRTIPVTLK
ncbi:immunoglobulin domain-containing family protein [Enterovibrio calviensis]|uniref:hypothetical protein n=1 Tax=Enterovibrio calviensis TaxID=91359 RepID=UPI00048096D3|nr:hypothetical protein [Enterovibrio calviensis]